MITGLSDSRTSSNWASPVIGMSWTNVGLGCLGCCSCPVDACAQTVISLLIHCWLLILCLILILLLLKWHEEIRSCTYIMLMLMLLHCNPTCDDDDDDDGEGEELSAVAFGWVVMMPNLKFVDILTCAHCSIMMGNPPRLSSSPLFHRSFLTLPAHHMPSLLKWAVLESPHNVDCGGALCPMSHIQIQREEQTPLCSPNREETYTLITIIIIIQSYPAPKLAWLPKLPQIHHKLAWPRQTSQTRTNAPVSTKHTIEQPAQ